MFISTMPLSIPVSASDTVEALANRITDSHRELFRHQRYPYSDILRLLREKHDFTGNLYDVMVSYQNAQTGVDAETDWFSNGYSETPFVLHIDNRDNGNSYTWTVDYQTEVFRQEAEIQLIIERLEHILQQILINYKIPVGEISIIPDAEYRQMIFAFNDTAAEHPKDKCILGISSMSKLSGIATGWIPIALNLPSHFDLNVRKFPYWSGVFMDSSSMAFSSSYKPQNRGIVSMMDSITALSNGL